MKKAICINSNSIHNGIYRLAYIYMLLPVMIFLIGWCRWYIGFSACIILLICFIRVRKDVPMSWKPQWTKAELEKLVIVGIIIVFWVYLSGIGMLVYQNPDHEYRNAIFEILVTYEWPVIQMHDFGSSEPKLGMIYYIGFWLPAAVIGKFFGIQSGYLFQFFWASLGVILFYYFVCIILKKIAVWPLIVFIFFSGLDIVGYYISGNDLSLLNNSYHLEWWSMSQFSSFTTQLFWVFNQAIPIWLVLALIYVQKKNRYMVLLLGTTLICSTLPFIGLIPFFLYFVMSREYQGTVWFSKAWWIEFYKDTFSFENILGGGVSGIISFIYLRGNLSGQNIVGTSEGYESLRGYFFVILIFILIEVGVYWIAIYKHQKKNLLFWIMILWLCLCPFLKIGYGGDFCMRASIPALTILYIQVVDTILLEIQNTKRYLIWGMVILLCIGSITPILEMVRTISNTTQLYYEKQQIVGIRVSDELVFSGTNFTGEIDGNFFFDHIAKKIN